MRGISRHVAFWEDKLKQSQTCCGIVPEAGAALAGLWTLQVKPGMGAVEMRELLMVADVS